MKISIWSDIRCPFCYIGKKKFETALERFAHKDNVIVEWKSFELDPDLKTQPHIGTIAYYADVKGMGRQSAEQLFGNATQMAKEVGLDFHIENAVTANSLNAHRLIHFAKTKGYEEVMGEALLSAYLIEGKNIDDITYLVDLAGFIGMDKEETAKMLASDEYTYHVRQDQMEAKNIGVNGVPFFVLNNKYGISGAQSPEAFLQVIEKAWSEYKKENPILEITKGDSCDLEGNCN